jgi:hypothetical protein
MSAPNVNFFVDQDQRFVTFSGQAPFSISHFTESGIEFEGESGGAAWKGYISRLSGSALLEAWRNDKIILKYELSCRLF